MLSSTPNYQLGAVDVGRDGYLDGVDINAVLQNWGTREDSLDARCGRTKFLVPSISVTRLFLKGFDWEAFTKGKHTDEQNTKAPTTENEASVYEERAHEHERYQYQLRRQLR